MSSILRRVRFGTASNPSNVPTPPDEAKAWMAMDPATDKQREWFQRLMDMTGAQPESLVLMYGRGYESPELLSKWAMSWGIHNLQTFAAEQGVTDAAEV